MKFTETDLAGAYIIDLDPRTDSRGFFARSWCEEEFDEHNLESCAVQCNISFNNVQGTLRGMHYQDAPRSEAKLVRCTAGAIHDVIVDLRPGSPTFMSWIAVELSARNRRAVYVPPQFAHGFQTLEDRSEVFYQMSERYCPDTARGVRWNDPAFGIYWPLPDPILSASDARYPDFQ